MKRQFSVLWNDFWTRRPRILAHTEQIEHVLSRFRRGTAEELVLRIAGLGLSFLLSASLTRRIGPEGFGVFNYALVLAGTLAMVTPLGWTTALMRFIGQYMEQQRWGLLRGVIRRGYQLTSLSAVLVALMLGGTSYWSGLSPELATSLRFAALFLPFLALVNLCRTAIRALQWVKASVFPQLIALPLTAIAGVYLFAITTAPGALLVYAGAALLTVLLSSALLLRSIPKQGRNARPGFKTRAWTIVALPMLFGSVSLIVMSRTDILMLGAMSDMETVGFFSVALRIATVSTIVFQAVNGLAASMIAAAFYGDRLRQVKAIMRVAIIFSTLGALPPFVIMIFWPQFLLGFFGPEFVHAESLLRVLALGQFVNAATGPVGLGLLMTGQERAHAWTTAAAAMGNVLGNLIAIPIWGGIGAAWVTAATVVIWNVCNLFLFLRGVARHDG